MSREARSHVRRRKHGCVTGCLVRVLLLLGIAALLFVGACVLGFVRNDPQTGAPSLTLEPIGLDGGLPAGLPALEDALSGVRLPSPPSWAYGVAREGLTVKTLRAGGGEAVLVCCDGYTLLVGAGENGWLTSAQLLLCGVRTLHAAVAMSAEDGQTGGMARVVSLYKPPYLFYTDTQVKDKAYNAMLGAAQASQPTTPLVASAGLSFNLGRAKVTFIGPTGARHTDERDDGLTLRVDYGQTSVLIMGTITAAGEWELVSSGAYVGATALLCARGGSDEATGATLVEAVRPQFALMTGKAPANSVCIRLQKAGAQVYTASEHGVMTLYANGQTMTVVP